LAALKSYYAHAYSRVVSIRFDFETISNQGPDYFAPWQMSLKVRGLNQGNEYVVSGISHLKFKSDGLVIAHRDYLDLGEMIYERLPVQGLIIRGLKKLLK
jgi:hypothetical protein